MTIRMYTDRSRIVTAERCLRRRHLEYHQDGVGIQPSRAPLPLAVGTAVHSGLAVMLREKQEQMTADASSAGYWSDITIEEHGVAAALLDFQSFAGSLDVDTNEAAAMQVTPDAERQRKEMIDQARELGMDAAGIGVDSAAAKGQFDAYLYAEQAALVEAMVRAYVRRRLRPLLEEFEVLEVEREGEWVLLSWSTEEYDADGKPLDTENNYELVFMSRPDALLRHRSTNELHILSYKTTGAWDVRKARDIQHDMQGLSEGVEVERRLAEWWEIIRKDFGKGPGGRKVIESCSDEVYNYLRDLESPPRIHAIRYEFLLKGDRWKDKELSARLGVEARSQRSHLIRQYVAVSMPKKGDGGYSLGDVSWSWDYIRTEDDKPSSLSWQNWKSRPIWEEAGGVADWIDKLDRSHLLMSGEDSTIGMVPRELGWISEAQKMGVTKEHPLDSVFVPPVTVYRNDDDLRNWVDQTEASERRIAEGVMAVAAAGDIGERLHLLNVHFPMVRSACEYPSQCPFARDRVGVCYASAEMKADPLVVGGGEYRRRVPNHPTEATKPEKKN